MTEEELIEVEEDGKPARKLGRGFNVFNLLTGCVLVLALLTCGCAGLIFINPRLPVNPFPPPTVTNTPGPTSTPTATPLKPTRTPTATRTPTPVPVSLTSPMPNGSGTPAATIVARFMADIQASPQTLPNRTCEDNSIAGEVRDQNGNHLKGYTIQISRPDGYNVSVISGSTPQYGPSGWEILLVNSKGTPEPLHLAYAVRLFDPLGNEVANPIAPGPQTTSNNCSEGVIYIIFREIAGGQ